MYCTNCAPDLPSMFPPNHETNTNPFIIQPQAWASRQPHHYPQEAGKYP